MKIISIIAILSLFATYVQSSLADQPIFLGEVIESFKQLVPENKKDRRNIVSRAKDYSVVSSLETGPLFFSNFSEEIRKEVRKEIFDILTDISFDFDGPETKVGSTDISLQASISGKKEIYRWDNPLSNRFRYVSLDTLKIVPRLSFGFNQYFGAEVSLGYVFQKYSQSESPFIYRDGSFKKSLLETIKEDSSQTSILKNRNILLRGISKSLKLFSQSLGFMLSKFSSNETFLASTQDILASIRTPLGYFYAHRGDKNKIGRLVPFSADKFYTNIAPSMLVGDIFSITTYLNFDYGLGFTSGVMRYSIDRVRNYSLTYYLMKLSDNKFKVKLRTVTDTGTRSNLPRIRLRLGILSYSPLTLRVSRTGNIKDFLRGDLNLDGENHNLDLKEIKKFRLGFYGDRIYEFDLSKKDQRKALDGVFSLNLESSKKFIDLKRVSRYFDHKSRIYLNLLFVKFDRKRGYRFEKTADYSFDENGDFQPPSIKTLGFGHHQSRSKFKFFGIEAVKNSESKSNTLFASKADNKPLELENNINFSDKNFRRRFDKNKFKKTLRGLLGNLKAFNEIDDRISGQERSWRHGKLLQASAFIKIKFSVFIEGLQNINLKDRGVVSDYFGEPSLGTFNPQKDCGIGGENQNVAEKAICFLYRVRYAKVNLSESEQEKSKNKDKSHSEFTQGILEDKQLHELILFYNSLGFVNKAKLMRMIMDIARSKNDRAVSYYVSHWDPKKGHKIIEEHNYKEIEGVTTKGSLDIGARVLLNISSIRSDNPVIQGATVFRQADTGHYVLEVTSAKKFKNHKLQLWTIKGFSSISSKILAVATSDIVAPFSKGDGYIYQFDLDKLGIDSKIKPKRAKTLQMRFSKSNELKLLQVPASEVFELVFKKGKPKN